VKQRSGISTQPAEDPAEPGGRAPPCARVRKAVATARQAGEHGIERGVLAVGDPTVRPRLALAPAIFAGEQRGAIARRRRWGGGCRRRTHLRRRRRRFLEPGQRRLSRTQLRRDDRRRLGRAFGARGLQTLAERRDDPLVGRLTSMAPAAGVPDSGFSPIDCAAAAGNIMRSRAIRSWAAALPCGAGSCWPTTPASTAARCTTGHAATASATSTCGANSR